MMVRKKCTCLRKVGDAIIWRWNPNYIINIYDSNDFQKNRTIFQTPLLEQVFESSFWVATYVSLRAAWRGQFTNRLRLFHSSTCPCCVFHYTRRSSHPQFIGHLNIAWWSLSYSSITYLFLCGDKHKVCEYAVIIPASHPFSKGN